MHKTCTNQLHLSNVNTLSNLTPFVVTIVSANFRERNCPQRDSNCHPLFYYITMNDMFLEFSKIAERNVTYAVTRAAPLLIIVKMLEELVSSNQESHLDSDDQCYKKETL